MQFISFQFIFFIFASLILYWAVPSRGRKYILLAANGVFYSFFGIWNLLILTGMILISYGFSLLLRRQPSRAILISSVSISLLPLLILKYAQFVAGLFVTTTGFSLIEPVGISFFTFKILSFLIDTYREPATEAVTLTEYAVSISFFPTITSGPIDKPRTVLTQIRTVSGLSYHTACTGLLMMLWGGMMKSVVADRLGIIVNAVYGEPSSYEGFPLLVTAILYTLQIYFDFAGYTYIARGTGLLFGFRVSQNFASPYYSRNIREFWQRWHITLSSWLKDYIYIPLGGNRRGTARKRIHLLITFLISGIWHGAGVNFILWGLYHGILQVIGDATRTVRSSCKRKLHLEHTLPEHILQVIITFLFVTVGWVLFRNSDPAQYTYILRTMFLPRNLSLGWVWEWISKPECIVLAITIPLVAITDLFRYHNRDVLSWFMKRNPLLKLLVVEALLFLVLIFGVYGPGYDSASFIYFQF